MCILDFLDGFIKKIANSLILSDFRFLIRIFDDKQVNCNVRVFLISI